MSGRDCGKFRVVMKDGTARLVGSAPTQAIKRVAERDTLYKWGVKMVVNKIQVRC